jgi:hypothetical protein
MFGNIVVLALILMYIIAFFRDLPEKIALSSTSKKWKWLRKVMWLAARRELVKRVWNSFGHNGSSRYKVATLASSYISKSLALRHYYYEAGLEATNEALIGKIEALQSFVTQYKYNTFGNLSIDEEDFIDNYLKNQHGKSNNS